MTTPRTQTSIARKERGRPQVTLSISAELLAFIDERCAMLRTTRSRYLELLAVKGGYVGPLT
jgi:hypothetical protein